MPIDLDFPKNHQAIGKHKNADGQNYHYVWGPGRLSDAAENEEAIALIQQEGKNLFQSEYMELWLQLIGMLVMQTAPV